MLLWDQLVEFIRLMIFAYAQACGGNLGSGIVAVSLLIRFAMLPLTVRIAKVSLAHQQAMAKLKPELDRIRHRYRDRPETIARYAPAHRPKRSPPLTRSLDCAADTQSSRHHRQPTQPATVDKAMPSEQPHESWRASHSQKPTTAHWPLTTVETLRSLRQSRQFRRRLPPRESPAVGRF